MNLRIRKNKIINISCYEIYKNHKLGGSNYSEVFLAKCYDDNKIKKYSIKGGLVAIKRINKSNLDSEYLERVNEEIEIMKIIKENPHPNIVNCIEIITDSDIIYIVLEYCENGDLSQCLGYSIEENVSKKYILQIIKSLDYLKQRKIIHRDIKPKNILLTNNKKIIKLCDFGLSKLTNNFERTYTICGSPLYMAPEILNYQKYSHQVDLWSVGIILYEMIFGFHPFINYKNINELRNSINNDQIPIPPPEFKEKINKECVDILSLLLEKSDKKRINIKEIINHNWLTKERNIEYEDIEKP